MPQTVIEWLTVLAVLGATALWAFRVLVWLVRIHDVAKAAIAELKNLRADHQQLTTRVVVSEEAVKQNGQQIAQIKGELGLA